jgi:hypothetical protein
MAEIQYLQAKHAELNNMKNINAARKQFSELAPAIKENILKLNPDYAYQRDPSVLAYAAESLSSGIKNIYKSPFQTAGKAITGLYNTILKTPYNIATGTAEAFVKDVKATDLNTAMGQVNFPAAASYLTTAKSWQTAWTGKDNWRESDVKIIDDTHGKGLSALIRGQIDGKKPGDIYREYGGYNYEMQSAIAAQSDYNAYLFGVATNQTENYPLTIAGKAYETALSDISSRQKEFGNDLTNFMNKNFPPSKTGRIGQLIFSSLSNPLWASYEDRVAAGVESKEVNKWRIANPNPFSKNRTSDPSGPGAGPGDPKP